MAMRIFLFHLKRMNWTVQWICHRFDRCRAHHRNSEHHSDVFVQNVPQYFRFQFLVLSRPQCDRPYHCGLVYRTLKPKVIFIEENGIFFSLEYL